MCRRVSLTGGSRGGREVGKAYACWCAAKAAAKKSYAYNMATAESPGDGGRKADGFEPFEAAESCPCPGGSGRWNSSMPQPTSASPPSSSSSSRAAICRVSKEATGIVWAAGAENGAGAKAEDADVSGAKGGRGDIKRRGEGKRLWCRSSRSKGEIVEAAGRKTTNKTEIYKYTLKIGHQVPLRAEDPPPEGGPVA